MSSAELREVVKRLRHSINPTGGVLSVEAVSPSDPNFGVEHVVVRFTIEAAERLANSVAQAVPIDFLLQFVEKEPFCRGHGHEWTSLYPGADVQKCTECDMQRRPADAKWQYRATHNNIWREP